MDRRACLVIDDVIQRNKGGRVGKDNFLPACTNCNRLPWGRTGQSPA